MNELERKAHLELANDPNPVYLNLKSISEKQREYCRNAMFLFKEGIVYWYEVVYVNEASVTIQKEKLEEIVKEWDSFVLLIDLTRAEKPNAEARKNLKRIFDHPKLKYVSIFTETNLLLRVAAKFVLSSSVNGRNYEVYKTFVEAEKRALKELSLLKSNQIV